MKRRLIPQGDYLLVERMEQPEKMVGGIIIPDAAKPTSQYARVIRAGAGELIQEGEKWIRKPVPFIEGDLILMHKYAENLVPLEGDENRKFAVIKADSVLCIVHEEPEEGEFPNARQEEKPA